MYTCAFFCASECAVCDAFFICSHMCFCQCVHACVFVRACECGRGGECANTPYLPLKRWWTTRRCWRATRSKSMCCRSSWRTPQRPLLGVAHRPRLLLTLLPPLLVCIPNVYVVLLACVLCVNKNAAKTCGGGCGESSVWGYLPFLCFSSPSIIILYVLISARVSHCPYPPNIWIYESECVLWIAFFF